MESVTREIKVVETRAFDVQFPLGFSSGIPEEIQEKSEVEREDRERRTQTTQERGKRGKAIFSECLHREEGT